MNNQSPLKDPHLPTGIMPQPQKGTQREKIVRFASLYLLHTAEIYMQGCATGKTDNLKSYLQWLDDRFWNAKGAMEGRKNWDVAFKQDDIYVLPDAKQKEIRKAESLIGMEGIAKYIYTMVRLFWDTYGESNNSLIKFTTVFIPNETKRVSRGVY